VAVALDKGVVAAGIALAVHVVAEVALKAAVAGGAAGVGVVVARDDGDGQTGAVEPALHVLEFGLEGEVGEVAGDDQPIGAVAVGGLDDGVEEGLIVLLAPVEQQVDAAGEALVEEARGAAALEVEEVDVRAVEEA